MELKDQQQNRALAALPERAGIAAVCCCLYAVLFGCLSSMGGLSSGPLLSLLPGFALLLLSSLLPEKSTVRRLIPVISLILGLILLLLDPKVLDGAKLYLNRLFAASEAKQRYRYDYFSVAAGTEAIPSFFLVLGLWTGAFFARFSEKHRVLLVLPFVFLFLWMAWLGLLPGTPWLAGTAASLAGLWILPEPSRPFPARLLAFGLCLLPAFLVLLFLPGTHPALSAWEQEARDGIAFRTAAYDDLKQEAPREETAAPQEEHRFEEIDPEPEPENGGFWTRPLRIVLLSVLILLLLFVPSVWSDRLRKKRLRNRAGLNDLDARVRTKAAFLYALRWLREAGFAKENCPCSSYLPQLKAADPELADTFAAVLPIWQAAAYSPHPVGEENAEEMARFLQQARTFSLSRLTKKQRFAANFFHALS